MSMSLRSANPILISRRIVSISPRAITSFNLRPQSTTSATSSHKPQKNQNQQNETKHYNYTQKDFSTHVAKNDFLSEAVDELIPAFQRMQSNPVIDHNVIPSATELNLQDAAIAVRDHNRARKILLMVCHGEAEHDVFEREWIDAGNELGGAKYSQDYPRDPNLTSRGVGQVLNISRRTAKYCTKETGLTPDLMVIPPQRHTTQSALLAFPDYSPMGFTNVPWICHPYCCDSSDNFSSSPAYFQELAGYFPGVDYSMLQVRGWDSKQSDVTCHENLLRLTDDFLSWITKRDERVIVVASHAKWLQSFCGYTLNFWPHGYGSELFKEGEMRALALKYE